MKIIEYWCDEDAPNYVLCEKVSIQTPIAIESSLTVRGASGYSYIDMETDGLLTINAEYAWDGATGIPDNKKNIFASLVHDALYQILRDDHQRDEPLLDDTSRKQFRQRADKLFKDLYRKNGANGLVDIFWTALAYNVLRLCGKRASQKSNTKSYWDKEIFEKKCNAPAKGAEL